MRGRVDAYFLLIGVFTRRLEDIFGRWRRVTATLIDGLFTGV